MEKIKHFLTEIEKGKTILSTAIIILIGVSSFIFGRLSKSNIKPGIRIEYPNLSNISQEASVISAKEAKNSPNTAVISQKVPITANTDKGKPTAINSKGDYFASNKGKKYYPMGCSAGKTIKLENRIYFSNAKEAESAGYSLSGSCQ